VFLILSLSYLVLMNMLLIRCCVGCTHQLMIDKYEQTWTKICNNDFTMPVTPNVNLLLMAILSMKNVRFKFIDPTFSAWMGYLEY
jgi:hypothetical protein